jgi:hypothetical protein
MRLSTLQIGVRKLVVTVFLFGAGPVLAHHGDAGRYEDTITEITGTVVALQLVNPHASIIFDVEDESGQTVRWHAEVSSANGMARVGWDRGTLKAGERITLFGRVVKSGAPFINLSENARLIRTDTCEELYASGMIFGSPPDYPVPTCD